MDWFVSVENMYKSGLYTSYVEIFPFLPTDNLSQQQIINTVLYQASSLHKLREYKRAEVEYQGALNQRKILLKTKTKATETDGLIFTETEIKYRMHECYIGMGQTNQAVNLLQSIPAKQRNKKVYHALGTLYHQSGIEKAAIAAFREVIRECPLALDAIKVLLQLGVTPREIQEIVSGGEPVPAEMTWYQGFLSSQAALYTRDYKNCVRQCKMLEEKGDLRGCVSVLVTQGRANHWAGEDEQARLVLERAANLDPLLISGMDTLAAVLGKTRRTKELDQLASRLMSISEDRAEPWIALGHYCHLNKNYKRAVYFAHKACLLDARNVEALLLKGNMFLDLKKWRDAMNHYREAMQIAPFRFEAHQGMVDCNIGLQRQREAITIATGACKQLGNSPRALTLYASVLLKEPLSVARAKTLLERASSGGHLPAIYLLVDLLEREGANDRAVDLLKRTLVQQNTSRLHQLLADLLAKQGQEEVAMEHYSLALSLDPKHEGALNGLHKMESGCEGGLEATLTTDMELAEIGSPHGSLGGSPLPHHDLEDSETEAVWSDGDLNIMGGS